ncbi:hypothetical protein HDF16_005941 [Granulicella aggregans]|uniref:Uncharacterized protein n=1 Tax=Granulicella aggregans TaxID=474949 RepID=A0A7W8E8E6_9BACT|nr:hypothetical protein [Granulicella aggregans]MBB5061205.1 hypothetical protein [Granulicella aggregans]
MADEPTVYKARFGEDVDKKLRKLIWRRGELLNLVILILQTMDLRHIPLVDIDWATEKVLATTVKLPASIYKKLKATAEERGVSMNVLINSAVSAYKPEKAKTSPKK